jgi:hypothetical protein
MKEYMNVKGQCDGLIGKIDSLEGQRGVMHGRINEMRYILD